jgi:hypothetical protein
MPQGDAIKILYEGKAHPGFIVLESEDGLSLAVQLEWVLRTGHGFTIAPSQMPGSTGEYVNMLVLSRLEDGSYLDVFTEAVVRIERAG